MKIGDINQNAKDINKESKRFIIIEDIDFLETKEKEQGNKSCLFEYMFNFGKKTKFQNTGTLYYKLDFLIIYRIIIQ